LPIDLLRHDSALQTAQVSTHSTFATARLQYDGNCVQDLPPQHIDARDMGTKRTDGDGEQTYV